MSERVLPLPRSSQFKWFSFPLMSVKNTRSSIHSVSASREVSSPLDCINYLISSKSDKKRCKTRPLLSHRISVCSNRSPYSADSSSDSTLYDLCCLALEWMLFMIFTSHHMIKAGHFSTYRLLVNDAVCVTFAVHNEACMLAHHGRSAICSHWNQLFWWCLFLHKVPLHHVVDVNSSHCRLPRQ